MSLCIKGIVHLMPLYSPSPQSHDLTAVDSAAVIGLHLSSLKTEC